MFDSTAVVRLLLWSFDSLWMKVICLNLKCTPMLIVYFPWKKKRNKNKLNYLSFCLAEPVWQYGPRSDCSQGSSLIGIYIVWFYTEGKKVKQLFIMGFPIGDLWSIRSFYLAGSQTCQLSNELMATRKWSKETKSDIIVRIWSAEHFNFKRNSIEREVIWINTIFNFKMYEKGEHNI